MRNVARFAVPAGLIALVLSASGFAAQIPSARDVAYPGTIALEVDVSDLDRRIFTVRETIPVRPGPLTLLYPQWLPGNHAPRGPIDAVAGLVVTANGRSLDWRRDAVDVYAFHLNVPAGARELEVRFQFMSPQKPDQGRVVSTAEIVGLQWNTVVLYPAGHFARRIEVRPQVTLPAGWKFAAALDVEDREGDTVRFGPVNLEMLVDSPLFAGRYFRSEDLDPGAKQPVRLNLFADREANLEITPDQLAAHRKLMQEMYAVFGSRHFDRYEFLLALSDNFGGIGLEHHRSSENAVPPEYFTDWNGTAPRRDLLPHELSHSWNGKFRRPEGLATPDYREPMRNDLLWVYEGMTNYWGYVIAARSGLWSPELARDAWAYTAATQDRNRPGRAWRPVEDTTRQPVMNARRPLSFTSWQRTEDYYTEGQLIWLDVDTKLRELTGDRRSLDDFCRAFFGVQDGALGPLPYDFEDVARALSAVAPFDWSGFLHARVRSLGPGAPLDGLSRGGWRLVYGDKPSDYLKTLQSLRKVADLSFSIGLVITNSDAEVTDVRWGSAAYDAGITRGTRIVAVNGVEYHADRIREAIAAAKGGSTPIDLLVKNQNRYRTVQVSYFDGPQYPRLERIDGAPDRLGAILASRTSPAASSDR